MTSQQNNSQDDTVLKLNEKITLLLNYIRNSVNLESHRIDFIRDISHKLVDFLDFDSVELWLKENSSYSHYEIAQQTKHTFDYEVIPITLNEDGTILRSQDKESAISLIRKYLINKTYDGSLKHFTQYGSFWINDTATSLENLFDTEDKQDLDEYCISQDNNSLALIPLTFGEKIIGIVQLLNEQSGFLDEQKIRLYEYIAQVLGSALITQRTQAALLERVKELTCVYNIGQVVERPGITHDEILHHIVELLPAAWQYPEITIGRIVLDGKIYSTSNFQKGWQKQKADIVVKGVVRGFVEVSYTTSKPDLDEGPFLREERDLITVIAQQIALIIKKEDMEKENIAVQEQLRHADRLATIGQLAAGVAHELNEPIGNILGFAQLIEKDKDLSAQARKDTEKIVSASLSSREVIKKLLLFAREMPPSVKKINLNNVVEEGLFFIEARCAKAGIELFRELSPNLPEITGDPSQLTQVLTNLVVNAMHAMPNGGRLTIETLVRDNYVILSVSDDGVGMSPDVQEKIFLPFYTTKDINEGTGLGLAVVHGIIISHKGFIEVESKIGGGTRFEIKLPIHVQ